MTSEMAGLFDPESPPPTSPSAPTNSVDTTTSGSMNATEPEPKVPKLSREVPAMPVINVKIEPKLKSEGDLSYEGDVSRRTVRTSSDSASAGTSSTAKARRARALLEVERAAMELAAAKMRVAKAELHVIETEESENDGGDLGGLSSVPGTPKKEVKSEDIPEDDTPPLPEPEAAAPSVVIPTPLNQPTMYFEIGDPVEEKPEHDHAEPKVEEFYEPESDKEAQAILEKQKADQERELQAREHARMVEEAGQA